MAYAVNSQAVLLGPAWSSMPVGLEGSTFQSFAIV